MLALRKASSRDTPAYWVMVCGVEVLFSYETPMAFRAPGRPGIRRTNDWGPTTGRHLKEGGAHDWKLIESADQFEAELAESLVGAVRDSVTTELRKPS